MLELRRHDRTSLVTVNSLPTILCFYSLKNPTFGDDGNNSGSPGLAVVVPIFNGAPPAMD